MTGAHPLAGGLAGLALAVATPALAQDPIDIGKPKAGMKRLEKTEAFIAEHGLKETLQRINNDRPPFEAPYPAIAIIDYRDSRHYIAAHTTYPSIVGLDFTEQRDLEKRKFIQNFFEQVKQGGGTAPTTNAVPPKNKKHLAQCYSEWLEGYKGQYWVATCYDHPSTLEGDGGSKASD